jgi:glycosyltransferase involved in cell wall biosynthesis
VPPFEQVRQAPAPGFESERPAVKAEARQAEPAVSRAETPASDGAGVLHPSGRPAPILFVITTTDFGGTENFLEQLVAGLDRERFAPLVCSLCPPGRAGQRIAGLGVPVETLGMASRPRPHQLLAGAWRLRRSFARHRVQLVHGLLYRANVVAALACRLARPRPVLVWGQHSQIATSEGWWAATAARWARPRADRIVAVAEAVKESLVVGERIPRDRIGVIANGVDAERFGGGAAVRAAGQALRARLGFEPGAITVGAVGRLSPEKGVSFLIEAVALVRGRGLPLALALVGDGPERAALERQAERLGIAAHVRFLGFQRHLEAIYPAFDLFALPSLEEASPMALLEAMACGCAVAASAVGGVPEILDRGRCGLLVEPASAGALARALGQLATEPDLRRLLAAEARARILADFDLPAMIRRHQQLYLSLLPTARG